MDRSAEPPLSKRPTFRGNAAQVCNIVGTFDCISVRLPLLDTCVCLRFFILFGLCNIVCVLFLFVCVLQYNINNVRYALLTLFSRNNKKH